MLLLEFNFVEMPKDIWLDKLQRLPLSLKLIGFGSFITIVSVFLPWYEDLDAFNTGDQFMGLSGPLYLLGFLVLAMAIGSFSMIVLRFLGKKLPNLPLEEAHFHIFVGAMSLFLLLITSSIYFHSKFGVNITMKEMKIGMITAFIGTLFVLVGGLRMNKEKGVSFESEGKLDRLIDVEDQNRVQRDVKEKNPETLEPVSEASVDGLFDVPVDGEAEAKTEAVAVNIESKND
jgi:hypothetical protein